MAQEQPKYFDIEDYETGKKYRVEAFADDVTYDEAVEHLSSLPEEEWGQYEYKADAAPQAAAPSQKTLSLSMETVPEKQYTGAVDRNNVATPTTRVTREEVNFPELEDAIAEAWRQGERDPAKLTAIQVSVIDQYRDKYPGLARVVPGVTPQKVAQALRYEADYKQRTGQDLGGYVFAPAKIPTGLVDPTAPETVTGSLFQSAKKAALQSGNTAVGFAAVGADIVGAEDTSLYLLDKYINNQAYIDYNNPDAVGSLENVTFDNAAQYAAEAIGGIIPDIATGGAFGYLGKQGGEVIAKRAVAKFIEDQVTAGVPREIAENIATQTVAKKIVNRSITAAVTGQSIAQETGAIYGDTYAQTGERAPLSSLAAGAFSGSLDAILPVRFLENIGITGEVTRQAFGRALGKALTEGAKGFTIEGATEAMQTFIAELPTSYITGETPFTGEMLTRLADSFVKGGIGGFTVSAASSAATGDYKGPQATPIIMDRESTIVTPEGRRNSKKYKQGLADATVRGQEIVDDVVSGWTNQPNVRVVENFQNERFENDALGVYEGDGNIVLNTEAIIKEANTRGVSPDAVMESVLFHEALGHYGLESLYHDNLDATLTRFYTEGSKDFVRMVDSWVEQNPGAYIDANGEVDIARAAEEVLAEMSEEGNIPRSMVDELLNMIKDFMRNMGLDNTKMFRDTLKYSERELRTVVAMGQAKVRTGEQADLSTGAPSDKYMYIGRQELENNRYRGTDTAWNSMLIEDLAETEDNYANEMMMADPADRPAIFEKYSTDGESRQKTGWFIGPDKKWRFEISDKDAVLLDLPEPGDKVSLMQVLDHPGLYELYQNLGTDIDVTTKVMPSHHLGSFNPDTGLLTLNSKYRDALMRNAPEDQAEIEKALSTVLHEVQHGIQEMEGFASGGGPDMALRNMPDDVLFRGAENHARYLKEVEADELATLLDAVDQLKEMPEYKAYMREVAYSDRLYAEKELLESKYKGLSYEEKKTKPDLANAIDKWYEQSKKASDFKNVLHDKLGLPKYILASEGLTSKAITFYNDMMWAAKNQRDYDSKERALKATIRKSEDLAKAVSQRHRADVTSILKSDPSIAFDAYEHLFGEVEARDVEARRTMDYDERRATAPYSKTGILPENYAVTFDGRGPAMSTEPTPTAKYARPMRQNKKVEPLTIDELTADDLFNSLNALDILTRVTDNYVAPTMSLDDLQSEALLRDVPVSAVQKLSVNPGDFVVKMFQYDVVARKLNDRVATLAEKINSGRYTAKDKSDFLKASFAFEDVTAKIFGLQSEYGRALRAIQEMEFTSKKVRSIRDALQGLTGEAEALQGLDDPATFEKFARSMAKRIQIKSTPAESSLGDKFASVINTPRAIMSSFDLSAPMRQGVFFVGRKEYYKAWSAMFSGVRAEQNYTDMMKDVMRSQYYPLMSVGKLFISSLDGDLSSREESFQSNLAQNIPGVRRSEVAYAAFLNKLRTDLFTNYVKTFEEAGYELTSKVDPQTGQRVPKAADELTEKEVAILKGLGSFINAGTGRGNLTIGDKNGKLSRLVQSAGPLLNALLFSPGLIASRVRLLNPVWYATLPAPVRKQAIIEAGKFFPGLAMTLSLIGLAAAALGEEEEVVEWDPRSSNFLKVNIGGNRYDITGGMAQYMTLFTKGLVHSSNLLAGTKIPAKKTSTGGLVRYEDDFRDRTFFDDIVKFGRYKLSPMASLFADFADGKNAIGDPFTVAGAVGDRMMPLYMQDLLEIAEEEDGLSVGALAGSLPGFFGVGVSRYTPQPFDTEQELTAPDGWQDEELPDGENNFVIVRDGKVILKDNAARMYEKTVNAFFQEIIQEQVAKEEWPSLTAKEQAKTIEEAKRIARNETKRYISPLIGIEDVPEELEEEVEE